MIAIERLGVMIWHCKAMLPFIVVRSLGYLDSVSLAQNQATEPLAVCEPAGFDTAKSKTLSAGELDSVICDGCAQMILTCLA